MTKLTPSEDSARVYAGLLDLLERRINILLGKAGPNWRRMVGPTFDPHAEREPGGGRTCPKCRRITRYDVRVCPSCGTISR